MMKKQHYQRGLIKPNKQKSIMEMKVLLDYYLEKYYFYDGIHTKFIKTPYKYQESLG